MTSLGTRARKWLPVLLGAIVPVGIAGIALLTPPLQGTNDDCVLLVPLNLSERTTTEVVLSVHVVGGGAALTELRAILFVNASPVAELDPLADGATSAALTFHDGTPSSFGFLSDGDTFVVSPLNAGDYRLDLFKERCNPPVGRAEWHA